MNYTRLLVLSAIFSTMVFIACDDGNSASSSVPYVSLTDDRDGKTYKIVEIGSQWWMAENLTYGRDDGFYGWSSALNSCPSGWHLPSVREFETLVDAVGGGSNVDSVLELAKNLNDSTSLAFFWSSDSCEVTAYDRRYPIPSEEFAYSMELSYFYGKGVFIHRRLKYQSAFVRCVKDDE